MGQQFFTTPGADTWTVPDGSSGHFVGLIGGGGNGGDGSVVPGGGGGGGGNALSVNRNSDFNSGTVVNLNISTGTGDNSWFEASSGKPQATPGADGDNSGNGGAGGNCTAGTGWTFGNGPYTGGNGANGGATDGGGGGAAGFGATGGNASGTTGGTGSTPGGNGDGGNGGPSGGSGNNGSTYGGGGGGDGLLGASGGVGASGFITVSWTNGHLATTQSPTNAAPAATIIPAITVEMRFSNNSVDTNAAKSLTVAISNNPSGGTLSGTLTVSPVNGVYTFSDLSIDNVGTGYTLVFSHPDTVDLGSVSFDITAPISDTLMGQACL